MRKRKCLSCLNSNIQSQQSALHDYEIHKAQLFTNLLGLFSADCSWKNQNVPWRGKKASERERDRRGEIGKIKLKWLCQQPQLVKAGIEPDIHIHDIKVMLVKGFRNLMVKSHF